VLPLCTVLATKPGWCWLRGRFPEPVRPSRSVIKGLSLSPRFPSAMIDYQVDAMIFCSETHCGKLQKKHAIFPQ
jgi:hypothetical protein